MSLRNGKQVQEPPPFPDVIRFPVSGQERVRSNQDIPLPRRGQPPLCRDLYSQEKTKRTGQRLASRLPLSARTRQEEQVVSANEYYNRRDEKYRRDQNEAIPKDLDGVGKEKLIGYMPMGSLPSSFQADPKKLADKLKQNNDAHSFFAPRDVSGVAGGVFYAYDGSEKMDQFLTDPRNRMPAKDGFPTDKHKFPEHVALRSVSASQHPETYRTIATAFNDPRPEFAARTSQMRQEIYGHPRRSARNIPQ